jgi:anti-repressor protein
MNMNPITIFNFDERQIRVLTDERGEPWWVASDVCKILGLTNSHEAVQRLDDDEKNTVRISDGTPGNPNQTIVSEPGLYSLILRSNKPEAKRRFPWRPRRHERLPTKENRPESFSKFNII